ncbi:DUF2827 family protein [Paralysiella testudinis]|uniref:DUF2827 domain-containing protein n=1 Tax=Paralysiella testudinis TaxID=2809020 RepID=A0A892ZHD0_9NEIS|nr:DUF2827 family protein [Paralysiella testudinis]QRQ82043.1 DUF2827 domain-containing protein [Paralysiella testudinis]
MLERKSLSIGISFHLDDKCSDIWANGAIQNIIFLYFLLEKIPQVAKVSLVYLGDRHTPPDGLMLDKLDIILEPLDEVISNLDVLIEGSVMISPEHAQSVHEKGGKVISYRMGNDFILEMESFLFDKPATRYFNGAKFDAIWTIPQHEKICRSYFSIMLRAPLFVLPHIWSPLFTQKVIDRLEAQNIPFGYRPQQGSKRISSFESNINVVKTSYIPILICEQAYRTEPDLISHIYMCNTFHKKDNISFHNFIGRTDIVKNNIMTVEGRFQMPDFLARYTDIVVAHQWENALNYAYYDALYGGYPLIHNSDMLPVGYKYREFDAYDGAHVLLDVIKNHDYCHDVYLRHALDFLKRLHPEARENVKAHENALLVLFSEN